MARFLAVCLACCGLSRLARAEHAPPPRVLLDAPPAPELPAPEYARRPFELSAEGLLALPNCSEGSTDNRRCDGVGAGAGLGGMLLWRPSPFFAFGAAFDATGFAFHPSAASALQQPSASGHFFGLLGRVYFFDHAQLEPYVELALGNGGVRTSATESGVAYDESSSGPAVRAGFGLEFYLARHVRLGPAFTWTRLDVRHLERCGGARCVELDDASYGHGAGFSSFSLRVSVLLGAGM